jgi:hypothetical protein
MSVNRFIPNSSWSLVVTALAELGRAEIERRQRAAGMCTHVSTVEDQTDDRRNSMSEMNETTEATKEGATAVLPIHRAPNDYE